MKVINKHPVPRMDLNPISNHYVYNNQTEILRNLSKIHSEINRKSKDFKSVHNFFGVDESLVGTYDVAIASKLLLLVAVVDK